MGEEGLRAGKQHQKWNNDRAVYTCADFVTVRVRGRVLDAAKEKQNQSRGWVGQQQEQSTNPDKALGNGICYVRDCDSQQSERNSQQVRECEAVVSGMRLNRGMTKIIKGADDAKVIVFPRSVRTIGEDSFWSRKSLKQVIVNEGVETFDDWPDNKFRIKGPFSSSSIQRIRFPSTLKRLASAVFNWCQKLKRVELQGGLETIGGRCFYACYVQELHIPASVRKIGERMVDLCTCPKSVTFAENSRLEKVRYGALKTYRNFAIIVMPGMKLEIEEYVDDNPVVRVPDFGTVVGVRTLGQLRGLRAVELPEGLEIVGAGWFADSGIEKVRIPTNVREIQKGAFACCKRLRGVEFAEGSTLEKIGELCFYNSGLQSVAIPNRVREIPKAAFQYCSSLKTVVFRSDSALERIGPEAFSDTEIEPFAAPPSLKTIENEAFRACGELERVELNEGLEELGKECFRGSGVENIDVPASVEKIGEKAFFECGRLQKLTFASESRLKEVGNRAFEETQLQANDVQLPAGARVSVDAFCGKE